MGSVLIGSLFVFFFLNLPIAFSLGAAATLTIILQGQVPPALIPQRMFAAIDSFPLMAIPFFVLAGNLMSAGGISRRLIRLATCLIGTARGGLAVVSVMGCMFFATVSGSSAATAAAIGVILIPAMVQYRYPVSFAGATVASSAELGVIIPPSIPMVLFGVIAGQSIGTLFIAGVVPGIFIATSLMLTAYVISRIKGYAGTEKTSLRETWQAFKDALLALAMPFVILGGIYGGVFTPTEAAVVAVFYGFIVGALVYREINFGNIKDILVSSAITTASIMIIISTASTFGWIMTRERIPIMIAEAFLAITADPLMFLLLVNLLLLFIGTIFETSAALILLTPLLFPIAVQLGIHPIHFGIIMIVNLAVGMVTPPLGINLFVVCNIARVRIEDLIPFLLPYLVVLIVNIFIITYIPQITLWLPTVLGMFN